VTEEPQQAYREVEIVTVLDVRIKANPDLMMKNLCSRNEDKALVAAFGIISIIYFC
jgi:hypothetical protein